MATLDALKHALKQKVTATAPPLSPKQPLSDLQYSVGFKILSSGEGWLTYQDFIIPQLSQLLALFKSRAHVSVLEIGPGPRSVLGYLPRHIRRKIGRYVAFEPNGVFAARLEEWLGSGASGETERPLPCVKSPFDIRRLPFGLNSDAGNQKFDVILFCHSMYGMNPKEQFIQRALEMLVERPDGGMVVVFHRDGSLDLDGLVCHRTTSFPTGVIRVADDNEVLDSFAAFIAGFVMQDREAEKDVRLEWRKVCRTLGRHEELDLGNLFFASPNIMVAFTKHAIALPELTAQVPFVKDKAVKNREANLQRSASIVRPTQIHQIQQSVRWALKHGVSLAVVGGGHSGHCLRPNAVSIDMGAFDQIHILKNREDEGEPSRCNSRALVVADAGCKTGDIIRKAMMAGLTVPLGARPSVGAGLWLQGGIGHLARQYGLACDAIVGAVLVSVDSGEVLSIGCVPREHQPVDAVHPENEKDLLWAIKGAGTNFGIIVSVTFKASAALTFSVRNWVVPLSDNLEARRRLRDFDTLIAGKLPRNCSADAYLYWDTGRLHLGVTLFESSTTSETPMPPVSKILGPPHNSKTVDGVGLFDADMYVSGMHGGHGGSKTYSFKRCLFLKRIGEADVADILIDAIETRPSPLCYLHLIHGGEAVGDVPPDATAFGCRDWDFACVITGVWPRDEDGTGIAQATERWVYKVAGDLLTLSCGVYGADLGPDPRDAALAVRAFGRNRSRLACLKHREDPRNVLAYTCPIRKGSMASKLILLVTGQSGAGKDYCANIWVSMFSTHQKGLTVRAVSISDATKREYAAVTGADPDLLLRDRHYKEQHRAALTAFYQEQVAKRPKLPEEHFLDVVHNAADVDVLLITGMRDDAPVATFSHLVPDSRVLDVRVVASKETRRARRGGHSDDTNGDDNKDNDDENWNSPTWDYRPSLIFENSVTGSEATRSFAEHHLLPFVHEDLHRLASMVRSVPDFPRPGIEFRHVLDVAQQPGGLALCTALLRSHFTGDWAKIDAVACCEAGGFIYASALASRVDLPLALIRDAGKLPPPIISVPRCASHISDLTPNGSKEKRIEMERGLVPCGASVVVVDDVLATGKTLCAVLQLLAEAGIDAENVSVMVVAEFPFHCGRAFLRQRGFGKVNIQSLLVFGGA